MGSVKGEIPEAVLKKSEAILKELEAEKSKLHKNMAKELRKNRLTPERIDRIALEGFTPVNANLEERINDIKTGKKILPKTPREEDAELTFTVERTPEGNPNLIRKPSAGNAIKH